MQVQREQTVSKMQSLNVIRNLLLSTIGSIAYVRSLFPEDSFETKGLDGVAVKCLRRDKSIEGNTLLDWIERGCFDAIDHQYLQTLIFGIYLDAKKPLDLMESYQFDFAYPTTDSCQLEFADSGPSRLEISKSTNQLVRRLLMMTQNLEPLPENAYLTMRLYYTKNTPISYEPPAFKASSKDFIDLNDSTTRDIDMGQVSTRHHEMICKVKTKALRVQSSSDHEIQEESTQNLIEQLEPSLDGMEATQPLSGINNDGIIVSETVEIPESDGNHFKEVQEFLREADKDCKKIAESKKLLTEMGLIDRRSESPLSIIEPSCVCSRDISLKTVTCVGCNNMSHAVCYGITKPTQDFKCNQCIQMIGIKELKLLALHRRTVSVIRSKGLPKTKVGLQKLVGVQNKFVSPLFQWLDDQAVIQKIGTAQTNRPIWKLQNEALLKVYADLMKPSLNFVLAFLNLGQETTKDLSCPATVSSIINFFIHPLK